eukprot:gnl/TRDRNA2_/TRDRNA2_90957_c0_seq1.p1 gnl/TRDRNA2_/TRDRNA2_90957_c0~~gnl/TRDRNA2_/TRDRNA2_90957_c0_seq1.p1  ORF type:complete len:328 (-),score=50.24 gnl/TRDRNA2_/TRDRNA2_90957_c0_seq1:328-1311(-)
MCETIAAMRSVMRKRRKVKLLAVVYPVLLLCCSTVCAVASGPVTSTGFEMNGDVGLARLASDLFLYGVAQAVLYGVCLLAVWRFWPTHSDPWGYADTLAVMPTTPILVALSVRGTLETMHSVESRWHGQTWSAYIFLVIYTSRNFPHCFVLYKQKGSKMQKVLTVVHHILSIASFGNILFTGRMYFFGCFDGCCEVTNLFLNNLYLAKQFTVNGKALKDALPSWIYLVNGLLLWLSFIVFRIVLFPVWMYLWYVDKSRSPEVTTQRVTAFEVYFYFGVTVFLFCFSLHFIVPITKGILKTLKGGKDTHLEENHKKKSPGHEQNGKVD